jgi:Domain of unknown function (DUF4157)
MKSLATKQPSNNDSVDHKPMRATPGPVERTHSLSTLSTGSTVLQRQPSCACGGGCPRCQEQALLQTKLKISEPGDKYEQEAERIADKVMQMPESAIQRQVEPEEEEEEEKIQTKSIHQITPLSQGQDELELPLLHSLESPLDIQFNQDQDGGTPLSTSTRRFVEPLFRVNFDQVRLHTDRQAHQIASKIQARAFTYGHHIWLGKGESEHNQALMAHELTHVVQQCGISPSVLAVSPKQIQRLVDANRVSCNRFPRNYPIFTAIGTVDPVGVLQTADTRAIEMLTNVIDELSDIRTQVQAGATPAWPLISDEIARGMRQRLRLDPDNPLVWTGTGSGTVELIIRWYGNVRSLLTSGRMNYTCLDPDCDADDWAAAIPGTSRIFLCRLFWHDSVDNRAFALIHEAAHVYYGLEDTGGGAGNAHCLEQFIADANGVPIDPQLVDACRPPSP